MLKDSDKRQEHTSNHSSIQDPVVVTPESNCGKEESQIHLISHFPYMRGLTRPLGSRLKMSYIIKFIFCFFVCLLVLYLFRYHILYYSLRFKLSDKASNMIIRHLSKSEVGVDLAINDLSNMSAASRFVSFFILLWSDDKDTMINLENALKSDISESNIVQIIEILCILIEKTSGDKEYMNRLYQLIWKADKWDSINCWPYERYRGRSFIIKYSAQYLTPEETIDLMSLPSNKDFPEELVERFEYVFTVYLPRN